MGAYLTFLLLMISLESLFQLLSNNPTFILFGLIEQVTDPVIDMLEKVQTLSLFNDIEPLNNPFLVSHIIKLRSMNNK